MLGVCRSCMCRLCECVEGRIALDHKISLSQCKNHKCTHVETYIGSFLFMSLYRTLKFRIQKSKHNQTQNMLTNKEKNPFKLMSFFLSPPNLFQGSPCHGIMAFLHRYQIVSMQGYITYLYYAFTINASGKNILCKNEGLKAV